MEAVRRPADREMAVARPCARTAGYHHRRGRAHVPITAVSKTVTTTTFRPAADQAAGVVVKEEARQRGRPSRQIRQRASGGSLRASEAWCGSCARTRSPRTAALRPPRPRRPAPSSPDRRALASQQRCGGKPKDRQPPMRVWWFDGAANEPTDGPTVPRLQPVPQSAGGPDRCARLTPPRLSAAEPRWRATQKSATVDEL